MRLLEIFLCDPLLCQIYSKNSINLLDPHLKWVKRLQDLGFTYNGVNDRRLRFCLIVYCLKNIKIKIHHRLLPTFIIKNIKNQWEKKYNKARPCKVKMRFQVSLWREETRNLSRITLKIVWIIDHILLTLHKNHDTLIKYKKNSLMPIW